MEQAGFSIRGMAEQAHIPYPTLNRRLSGQFKPLDTAELIAIAAVLGTKASDLLRAAEGQAA